MGFVTKRELAIMAINILITFVAIESLGGLKASCGQEIIEKGIVVGSYGFSLAGFLLILIIINLGVFLFYKYALKDKS